jgi:hypothetical protein
MLKMVRFQLTTFYILNRLTRKIELHTTGGRKEYPAEKKVIQWDKKKQE